jgi:hypothetical protein
MSARTRDSEPSRRRDRPLAVPRRSEVVQYLRVLAGHHPDGHLLEVRYATAGGGMRRFFHPAVDIEALAETIIRIGRRTDVYTGVALRSRRQGGRGAITQAHLVHVELDQPDSARRLDAFRAQPTMVIASGSPGHLHAYWQLTALMEPLEVEQANRALARCLGGDLASVDIARILRPPGTRNHKYRPTSPVELVQLDLRRVYTLAQLVPGPQPTSPSTRPSDAGRKLRRTPKDELLLEVPAAKYVRILTGREPDRRGKVSCPFHDDQHPSLQLYDDGTWYCFGCRHGGSIYDFAALLWGHETKGPGFLDLRDRLTGRLSLLAR